ncbi:hypothetical protein QP028_12625 [Corynebacterium suedekumii]|nr:hypothetical protein QP028_12625 [Corynebacterium suedekumii]
MTPKLHDIPPLLRSWAMRVTPGGGRRLGAGTRRPALRHPGAGVDPHRPHRDRRQRRRPRPLVRVRRRRRR